MSRRYRAFGMQARKKKKRVIVVRIFIFAIFIVISTGLFVQIDKKMMPAVIALAETKTKNRLNQAINSSVGGVTARMDLTSADFYRRTLDEGGRMNSLAVNTLLVNDFCNQVADAVTEELYLIGKETVSMPMGSITGIEALANLGPLYSVDILHAGNVWVDYESSFEAAGINQINFQIWLTVNSAIRIVNPLRDQEVSVGRKVSLVNTIISGDVPPVYLNKGIGE